MVVANKLDYLVAKTLCKKTVYAAKKKKEASKFSDV